MPCNLVVCMELPANIHSDSVRLVFRTSGASNLRKQRSRTHFVAKQSCAPHIFRSTDQGQRALHQNENRRNSANASAQDQKLCMFSPPRSEGADATAPWTLPHGSPAVSMCTYDRWLGTNATAPPPNDPNNFHKQYDHKFRWRESSKQFHTASKARC